MKTLDRKIANIITAVEGTWYLAVICWAMTISILYNASHLLFGSDMGSIDRLIALAAVILIFNVYRIRYLMFKGKL